MSLRKALFLFSLSISTVCLAGGYGMAGQWVGAGLILVPILAWTFSQRFPLTWLAPACMVSLVCLAAIGLIERAPAFLMVIGATSSLAAWDLQNLDRAMRNSSPTETARQFEKNHLQSLALALGLGLLLVVTGSLITLQVPFILLILLIILDLVSLDRVFRHLKNRRELERPETR